MDSTAPIIAKPSAVESREAQVGEVTLAFLERWDRGVKRRALPQPEPFVTAENERPVLDDRSTNCAAELILHEWHRRVRCAGIEFLNLVEKLVGIQSLIPQIFVPFSVPGVGSGLGAHIDDAAGKLAPLGAKIVVLHLELRNRVLGRYQKWQVDVADIQGLTIQILRALIGEGAADLVVGKVEGILAHDVTFRAALRNHRRSDRRQIKDVASIQRQFVGLALIHNRTERRGLRLQQRRLRRYFHHLTHFADLKRGIHMRVLLHVHRDIVAHEVLEPLLFHVNPVLAGKEVHKVEQPVGAAGLRALFLCTQVRQRHIGVRDRSSRRIGDCARDRAICVLPEK